MGRGADRAVAGAEAPEAARVALGGRCRAGFRDGGALSRVSLAADFGAFGEIEKEMILSPNRSGAAQPRPATPAQPSAIAPGRGVFHLLPKARPRGRRMIPLAPGTRIGYHPALSRRESGAAPASISIWTSNPTAEKRPNGASAPVSKGGTRLSVARPKGVSSACFVPKALGRAFCGDNPEGAPPSFPRRTNGNTDGEGKETKT